MKKSIQEFFKKNRIKERRLGMFIFLLYNWPPPGGKRYLQKSEKDNLVKINFLNLKGERKK